MIIDGKEFDFIDFGASKGGSIILAQNYFKGRRGLGIDLNPKKVAIMREAGYDCLEGNIVELDLPPNSVRFVVMSHFLEHLPNLEAVKEVTKTAVQTATDFLFIQGPYFDADEYLENLNLKYFWSDWHGHPCHLTISQYAAILAELNCHDFSVMVSGPVRDSADPSIHPITSPRDQQAYDPEQHPAKPFVSFPVSLFREMIFCIKLRQDLPDWDQILAVVKKNKKAVFLDATAFPTSLQGSDGGDAAKKPAYQPSELFLRKMPGYLSEIQKRLLLLRRWSYLQYLHLRQGLMKAEGTMSVLAAGCGRGYAELALALEFPRIRFHLTNPPATQSRAFDICRELVKTWDLQNVTFDNSDPLSPSSARYDLVMAVNLLQYVENDQWLAAELRAKAQKYVFVMAPFANEVAMNNQRLLEKLRNQHQQFRVGYDEAKLRGLFPKVKKVRGCLWIESGVPFREKLAAMSDEEITGSPGQIKQLAEEDLLDRIPEEHSEAQGIWILAGV